MPPALLIVDPAMTPSCSRRRLVLTFQLSAALLLLTMAVLPPHVAARCFGVPEASEEPSREGSWSLRIQVTTANGFSTVVTLGVDPNATDGYDRAFDAVEPIFTLQPRSTNVEFTLYAYFYYPDNPETAGGSSVYPEATVGLRTSIIGFSDNMTWPLQIAYLFEEDTVINLRWDANGTRQLRGYVMELFTPAGEVLPMSGISNYSFPASPGIYDFIIRALSTDGQTGFEGQPIVASVTAYVFVLLLIIGLRRMRRRGRS
jgi:hypothetical protein